MSLLDNVVVTDIEKPFIYLTEKERTEVMENRPNYCIAFCSSGQIAYIQDGTEHVLKAGQALLLPQGSRYIIRGDKRSVVFAVSFSCTGLPLDGITIRDLSDPAIHFANYKRLSELFSLPDKRLAIFSAFYELLRQVSADEAMALNPLRSLLDYIERHIGDPALSNAVLAEKLSISEVYLRRLFLKHCGITPKQYILELRIEKAKQLLADHLYSVTEIAEKCGFSGVYHFCRAFKQRTGATPSDYAARHVVYKI